MAVGRTFREALGKAIRSTETGRMGFDLPTDEIARMKAACILYDAEPSGEFLQLYSRPFGNGTFFEIVERRGGYAGYGAPNAPFRIAAQKRLMRPKGMPAA
mgnify:CR=1 FL=1